MLQLPTNKITSHNATVAKKTTSHDGTVTNTTSAVTNKDRSHVWVSPIKLKAMMGHVSIEATSHDGNVTNKTTTHVGTVTN